MPDLNPEHFRRLIRRKGQPVLVFSAFPLSSRAPGQATYQRGQRLPLEPGQAVLHGYVYHLTFPPVGTKVWINNATRSRRKSVGGVMEGADAEISWMPDEYTLSAPDLIVQIKEEDAAKETTTLPYDGQPLELTRPYVFSVEVVVQDASYWRRGVHFECVPAPETIGILSGGGVILNWLGDDRPSPGSSVTVVERFRPVLYYSGESEKGGRRSRFGTTGELSSLLPRNGNLSFIHPDAALEKAGDN